MYSKMENKKCSSCKIEKESNEFGNSSRAKDGKRSQCKCCEANYREAVKNTNLQVTHKKCSTCNIEKVTSYFSRNKSQKDNYCNVCKECVKKRYANNTDIILHRNQLYRIKNADKILKSRRESYKNNYKNPLNKLSINISNLIRGGLSKNKYVRTEEIVGCTIEEFKLHIESQFLNWMNWDNHGNCKTKEYNCSWDLDHIIPISYAKTEEEIYLLNHWSNFQPLCSKVNRGTKNKTLYSITNLELNITINN